jgi:RNA polymerase sigma-70 factor, ECF subfamily
MLAHAIDVLHRREGGRILATLIRFCGNFALAEDALQEALARACVDWRDKGLPNNAAAWLTTTARRWLIDHARKARHEVADDAALADAPEQVSSDPAALIEARDLLQDDLLRLIFTCCHPAISPRAQSALALNTVCRLTAAEIARAFLEAESTTAQRLVRAKRKISDAGIPFAVPQAAELPDRLATVLDVIYLVFNEGYTSASAPTLMRVSLCEEALRLARLLVELLPNEPEALGLTALIQFHHARRTTRVDSAGELVPLDEQDRAGWDPRAIREATTLLDRAVQMRRPGARQIEAAIAALHCQAARAGDTDWPQIAALYGALYRHRATDVVALNAAVAHAFAFSLRDGLAQIDAIAARGTLSTYHLLPAARADLMRRLGDRDDAARAYQDAIALCDNHTERRYLQKRLADLTADK